MCSCASLPSRKPTITTSGTSTRFPVGAMPGSIQSISDGVGELEHHLIDESIGADGARDRSQLRVRRHLRNEVLRVEVPQRIPSHASRHHRHVVDVGVFNHRGKGRFRVVRRELAADVLLPEIVQDLLGRCER